MRVIMALLLAVVSLPLVAAEPVRLGLVLAGGGESVSKAALAAMRVETEKILDLDEIRFEWRGPEGLRPGETFDRIVVVRFVEPEIDGVQVRGLDGPLGSTQVSEGRVLPFVTLDSARVRRTVERLAIATRTPATRQDLGRALGRVLSHELYHVLSASQDHDSEGVAQAALSGRELVRGELRFTESTRERIRQGLRRALD